jgi:hypothetical protein
MNYKYTRTLRESLVLENQHSSDLYELGRLVALKAGNLSSFASRILLRALGVYLNMRGFTSPPKMFCCEHGNGTAVFIMRGGRACLNNFFMDSTGSSTRSHFRSPCARHDCT